eukprot:scaffold59905_cov74-Phaeocystis_antarctica.AAC.1
MFNDMDKSNNHHAGNHRQEAHIPVGPQESLDHRQDSMTPRQWALHVARERMQIACTDVEIKQVVLTLAKALGASKVEDGSIKALHAVLLKLERPEIGDKEATPPREPRKQTLRGGESRCSTPGSTACTMRPELARGRLV